MTYATLAAPAAFLPTLDPGTVAKARRIAATTVKTLSLTAQSVTMAAVLWLILATPGAFLDQASTLVQIAR